jgi:hypothetical protein
MTSQENQDRQAVAHRAYELYLSRGGKDGSDQSDWYRAEAELRGGNVARKTIGAAPMQASAAQSDAASSSNKRPTTGTATGTASTGATGAATGAAAKNPRVRAVAAKR